MSFPSVTNVDGSNPGPNVATPDTPQSPVGNVWKLASLTLSITPLSVSNASAVEQTFTCTGLLTTDVVYVNPSAAQTAGLIIGGSRCSAANVLAINFANVTAATKTPVSGTYEVSVTRVQPNWVQPATNIDW